MAVTVDSKIKEILDDPRAADIVAKYSPGFKTDRQMKMVHGLSLRALSKFPQAKALAENLAQIEKEFAELK
jgi:hypothetical protein